MSVYIGGVRSTWLCLLFGHKWQREWWPVGHVPNAEHRPCLRDCPHGQLRYTLQESEAHRE